MALVETPVPTLNVQTLFATSVAEAAVKRMVAVLPEDTAAAANVVAPQPATTVALIVPIEKSGSTTFILSAGSRAALSLNEKVTGDIADVTGFESNNSDFVIVGRVATTSVDEVTAVAAILLAPANVTCTVRAAIFAL